MMSEVMRKLMFFLLVQCSNMRPGRNETEHSDFGMAVRLATK